MSNLLSLNIDNSVSSVYKEK